MDTDAWVEDDTCQQNCSTIVRVLLKLYLKCKCWRADCSQIAGSRLITAHVSISGAPPALERRITWQLDNSGASQATRSRSESSCAVNKSCTLQICLLPSPRIFEAFKTRPGAEEYQDLLLISYNDQRLVRVAILFLHSLSVHDAVHVTVVKIRMGQNRT
jgi:hypothetical protein